MRMVETVLYPIVWRSRRYVLAPEIGHLLNTTDTHWRREPARWYSRDTWLTRINLSLIGDPLSVVQQVESTISRGGVTEPRLRILHGASTGMMCLSTPWYS